MRRFELHRDVDDTGVSGVGLIAWGVEFPDGRCVLRWATGTASTAVYDSIADVGAIHGHGGHTRIVWVDEPPEPEPVLGIRTTDGVMGLKDFLNTGAHVDAEGNVRAGPRPEAVPERAGEGGVTTLFCYQCLTNHEATEALSVLDGMALCAPHLSERSKKLKREHDETRAAMAKTRAAMTDLKAETNELAQRMSPSRSGG